MRSVRPIFVANQPSECGNSYINRTANQFRFRREVTQSPTPSFDTEIFVETAVFVDKDLFSHMTTTFPVNTEKELIRFVLALINAVGIAFTIFSLRKSDVDKSGSYLRRNGEEHIWLERNIFGRKEAYLVREKHIWSERSIFGQREAYLVGEKQIWSKRIF